MHPPSRLRGRTGPGGVVADFQLRMSLGLVTGGFKAGQGLA